MDFTELKNKDVAELTEMLGSLREEVRVAKAGARSGAYRQNHKIKELRSTIARINTLIHRTK
ncbi:MAG TPA: 50S ribosomal protein L29 [Patescibacteria group bacterium]|nr:50S ribosomal protein L29 [Patescibacteria group bacterium]